MSHTAVVILNYNGEKLLRQFLPSVVRYSTGAEVIVADNGSTDQSITLLEKEFPSVRIIRLDKNYGFCGGYNKSLAQVEADNYVLLNSDIEVTPNWLESMVQLLDGDESIAAVQPKVLSYNNREYFEYAGAAGGFLDALGYPFCRGRIFTHVEKDSGQYNDTRQIFWATGACLLIRSKTYWQFDGLDEDFFAHMEEIDLCWKLQRAHHKVYYSGLSTVYHVGAGTLGYGNPRKTYFNFRNGLSLIFKHLGPYEILYKLPTRILLDWLAALSFLLKGDAANFSAVFKAHLHFIRNMGRDWRKRTKLQQEYAGYSKATILPGLILVDFYLKGKKIFTPRA